MLGESSAFFSSGTTAFGWLALVALVMTAIGALPLIVLALRRRLPRRDLDPDLFPLGLPLASPPPTPLPELRLGFSEKVRRSPRHAVAAHRVFLMATFTAAMGLVLLSFSAALPIVGEAGVLVAAAFAVPTLLVACHSRRRDLRPRSGFGNQSAVEEAKPSSHAEQAAVGS